MICLRDDVLLGVFYYSTKEAHCNNTETMNDFLNCELGDDSEFEVTFNDGTYSEIKDVDTGKYYEVHASGNGDSFNHKIEFKEIIK